MKLKRFLALAVSAIMVLAMVPAMTVSAAGTTSVIDALGGDVLWACPDGSFNDTAIGTAFSGWSSNITSGYVNVKTYSVGNTIQYYVNGTANVTTITSPGYGGNGEDAIVIEWIMKRQNPSDLYFDFSFTDKDGAEIAFVKFDRNYTSVSGEYYMGYPAEGTDCAIVATNNGDGTHKVEYYVAGDVVSTIDSKAGTVNGFGGITSSNGRWSTTWNHIGFANLTIGAVSFSETRVDVTATYTVNGEAVYTETGHYDPAKGETGVAFGAYSYSANGSNVMYHTDGATLAESGEIALEVVANAGTHAVGDVVAISGVQYEVKSDNLVPNGDFAYGTAGWYTSAGNDASTGAFTANTDGTVHATGHTGSTGNDSLFRGWAVETGKQYLFTFTSSTTNTYLKVSNLDSITTSDSGNVGEGATGTNNMIFTAAEFEDGEGFLVINFRWLGSDTTLGNFGLYEIAEAETVVTETVASVAEIATIKTFEGTEVVLPATVAVTGSLGSTADATIDWAAPESYDVGTTTVEGTATVQFGDAEPIEFAVSVNVMVYEVKFTLADLPSGGTDNVSYFPVSISDEFYLEFTMSATDYDNLWIYIGADGQLWGSGQIGLGWDNSGNGYFRAQPAAQTNVQFATGNSYRMFVTGNAATDTYSLTVYDLSTGNVILAVEDYAFRSGSDYVNAIAFTPNGENGAGTMSDIKVNANVRKNEYTVSVTMNGETTETTMSAWSAEALAATFADIAGYEKTVSYDEAAKTVTVIYTATQTLSATFRTPGGLVIKEVSEVVEVGGTYTVEAEEVFVINVDNQGSFYQIPETVLSADNNDVEVTVVANFDKLPVMEDMLVSDNEVWGIKATNENSVFVAAGADANRGATVDANGENAHDANHTPATLGKSRVGFMQFPVVAVAEGEKVTANFYVREWHGNGFSNSNATLRFTVTAINDDSWTTLSNGGSYDSANAPVFEGYTNPVFSPVCYNNTGYVAVDITEMMMAACEAGLDTITLKLNIGYGAAYIAEREACVAGGAYAGKASYLAVEDAGLVRVTETGNATLTKNGSDVNGVAYVAAGDDVRLNASGAIVVGTDNGYYMANENLNITEAVDFANTAPATLGLAMVSGAQVRIGSTELAADGKLDAQADSGLRFLATANYTDTVLADAEFGIKVQAEASDKVAYVKAENFQKDDNSVFSAAITNLAESNYNRKYTACAYAKVTMADGTVKEFTTDSVTRSIYQVSAGIMKNGAADADDAAYTVDGVVKNILNAYVNQTGIRLTYTADGITVEEGKYTGDVFFTVNCESDGDDGWNVTITPDTSWGTPAEIASWWTDYVRFNNNNSVAKEYISGAAVSEDGVLTFNFDTTKDVYLGDTDFVPV